MKNKWIIPIGVLITGETIFNFIVVPLLKSISMQLGKEIIMFIGNIFPYGVVIISTWWYCYTLEKKQRLRLMALNYITQFRVERSFIEINKIRGTHFSSNKLGDLPVDLKIDIEMEKIKVRSFLKNKYIGQKEIDNVISDLYGK